MSHSSRWAELQARAEAVPASAIYDVLAPEIDITADDAMAAMLSSQHATAHGAATTRRSMAEVDMRGLVRSTLRRWMPEAVNA